MSKPVTVPEKLVTSYTGARRAAAELEQRANAQRDQRSQAESKEGWSKAEPYRNQLRETERMHHESLSRLSEAASAILDHIAASDTHAG